MFMTIGDTMLYQPKLLTPMGVIATVSVSSLRAINMVKIILLAAVGVIAALCVSWVNFAMQLSAPYITLRDFFNLFFSFAYFSS